MTLSTTTIKLISLIIANSKLQRIDTLCKKFYFSFPLTTKLRQLLKVSGCFSGPWSFWRRHLVLANPLPIHRIWILDTMFQLIIQLSQLMPIFSICKLLNNFLWNVFAARSTLDELRLMMLGPGLSQQVPGWNRLKALSNQTTQPSLSTFGLALFLPLKVSQEPGSGSLIPSRFS